MNFKLLICTAFFISFALLAIRDQKPVVYLIGDSTVASASSQNPIQGWGAKITALFDSSKVAVKNRSVSGISSRTYQTGFVHDPKLLENGMWKSIMSTLKSGDVVIMQFGHNDESPVSDTSRMRGSIKGNGNDSLVLTNHFTKRQETVYSYGYYLKRLVSDIKSRGATAIICSPIPKNKWKDGRVLRNNQDYGLWAKTVAKETDVLFIDLNQLVADQYDREGQEKVTHTYFVADGVHTTQVGAELNASLVVKAIKQNKKCKLNAYLNH